MIKVEIIGGAGYTAGELLRLLVHHPEVEITNVVSRSFAGQPVKEVHNDLFDLDMHFGHKPSFAADVLFLCMGHGQSRTFLQEHTVPPHMRIIDLSQDFRLADHSQQADRHFVYGLPEVNKQAIARAKSVANPGCFATAIQLALLPLAAHGWLHDDVHIQAVTGSTGAGQAPTATTHFSWRYSNLSVYKPFVHQHLAEINETLDTLQPAGRGRTLMLPVRGNFTRGIFATLYTAVRQPIEQVQQAYAEYYRPHPFVKLTDMSVHLKMAVNTNLAVMQVANHEELVFITIAIDNLLKGAAGQAVQNMNLMFDLPETTGLKLKSSYY